MWLPAYATRSERLCRLAVVTFAFAVLVFLVGPLFVVFPLSVSKDPFFTFPIEAYSWRWYADFFQNARWTQSLWNSLVAATFSTALATLLSMAETMLAPVWVGLVHGEVPATRTIFGGVIILTALIGYLTAEFLRQRRLNTTGRAMPPIA